MKATCSCWFSALAELNLHVHVTVHVYTCTFSLPDLLPSENTCITVVVPLRVTQLLRYNNCAAALTLERMLGSAAMMVESAFIALVLTCTAGSFSTRSSCKGRNEGKIQFSSPKISECFKANNHGKHTCIYIICGILVWKLSRIFWLCSKHSISELLLNESYM